jgi:hypothetical protein
VGQRVNGDGGAGGGVAGGGLLQKSFWGHQACGVINNLGGGGNV